MPLLAAQILCAAPAEVRSLVVTNDLVLDPGVHALRLVVRANGITIDGNGAALIGPGSIGDATSLAEAGIGILAEGVTGVVIKNLVVHGFATGLVLRQVKAVSVVDSDFSDNYHNPKHGWGELPPRGGILCEQVHQSVFQRNRANRVWDGIHLVDSEDNVVMDNDFSRCSNTAAKLWKASRNKFIRNNLSYGIRIDRSQGEVHARDSTGVLIETGSNDNYWFQNDITHGGDGIFIRPLNRWVSRGNIFVENDTSYANNNCVESWSPGNIFIRNKANHGSYGFWLGGSDQTVLIGNEAAYNGLPTGNHNAPEPGFGHGGIVIVGGPSSHTLIQGNYVHDNHGAGIAFRGDAGSQGKKWQTEHWAVQQNRVSNNLFGIWGRWGHALWMASNTFTNNSHGNYLTNVSQLTERPAAPADAPVPQAVLEGPDVAQVGRKARFDASGSSDPGRRPLSFRWFIEGEVLEGPTLERVFKTPGFYRLSLTVENGALASLAWRDLLVVAPVAGELGTEEAAAEWEFELEANDDQRGRIQFRDEPAGVIGQRCLRFRPDPYPGAYARAVYPKGRQAQWDFSAKERVRFWMKAENPNLPGFQNPGPVVRLVGENGFIEYKPARGGNLLNDPAASEGRWLWSFIEVPLAGSEQWERSVQGDANLARIRAISIGLDSWGWDPFTVWLDGLAVE